MDIFMDLTYTFHDSSGNLNPSLRISIGSNILSARHALQYHPDSNRLRGA